MAFKFVLAVLAAVSQANAACVPCGSVVPSGPTVLPGIPAPDSAGLVGALLANLQPTINSLNAQIASGALGPGAPAPGSIVYTAPGPAPGQIVYPAPAPAPGQIVYPAPAPAPGQIVYPAPAPAPGQIVYPAPAPAPGSILLPAPAPGPIVLPAPAPGPILPPVVPCPDAPTKVTNQPDVTIPVPLPSEIPVAKVCTCQKYSIKPALVPCAPSPPTPYPLPGPVPGPIPGTVVYPAPGPAPGTVVYPAPGPAPGTVVYPAPGPAPALCCS